MPLDDEQAKLPFDWEKELAERVQTIAPIMNQVTLPTLGEMKFINSKNDKLPDAPLWNGSDVAPHPLSVPGIYGEAWRAWDYPEGQLTVWGFDQLCQWVVIKIPLVKTRNRETRVFGEALGRHRLRLDVTPTDWNHLTISTSENWQDVIKLGVTRAEICRRFTQVSHGACVRSLHTLNAIRAVHERFLLDDLALTEVEHNLSLPR